MDAERLPTRVSMLREELAEAYRELRRIDAKARDLLVVATFALTVAAIVCGVPHSSAPPVVVGGFVLAALPWAGAVIHLILVIRPTLVPDSPLLDMPTVEARIAYRRQVLVGIATAKYELVRRAANLLLSMLVISAVSGLLWLLL